MMKTPDVVSFSRVISCPPLSVATRNWNQSARDETRPIAEQEHYHLGDLVRSRRAPERNIPERSQILLLAQKCSSHGTVDQAGAHGIDPNSLWAEIIGKVSDKPVQGPLAGRVVRTADRAVIECCS